MVNLNLFIPWIKHAQVSGRITKQITALRASNPTFDDIVRTITHLERDLKEWHDSLPSVLRIETDYSDIPSGLDPVYVLYMQFAYLGGLITIHSLLAHPWNAPSQMQPGAVGGTDNHIAQSTQILVDASRQIIRKLKHVTVDVCCPRWYEPHRSFLSRLPSDYIKIRLGFTTPLTAFMNLFFYIVQCPLGETVKADLDCMYCACGHFSYLEYVSPGIKFPFPRQVTNLARSLVVKAHSSVAVGPGKTIQVDTEPVLETSASDSSDLTAPLSFDVRTPPYTHDHSQGLTRSYYRCLRWTS
jgi:hypothetical protein